MYFWCSFKIRGGDFGEDESLVYRFLYCARSFLSY